MSSSASTNLEPVDRAVVRGVMEGEYEGATWCKNKVDGTPFRCDQMYVRIKGMGDYTPGLTCHEAGHAVGVVHPDSASPLMTQLDRQRLSCSKATVSPTATLSFLEEENLNYVY